MRPWRLPKLIGIIIVILTVIIGIIIGVVIYNKNKPKKVDDPVKSDELIIEDELVTIIDYDFLKQINTDEIIGRIDEDVKDEYLNSFGIYVKIKDTNANISIITEDKRTIDLVSINDFKKIDNIYYDSGYIYILYEYQTKDDKTLKTQLKRVPLKKGKAENIIISDEQRKAINTICKNRCVEAYYDESNKQVYLTNVSREIYNVNLKSGQAVNVSSMLKKGEVFKEVYLNGSSYLLTYKNIRFDDGKVLYDQKVYSLIGYNGVTLLPDNYLMVSNSSDSNKNKMIKFLNLSTGIIEDTYFNYDFHFFDNGEDNIEYNLYILTKTK